MYATFKEIGGNVCSKLQFTCITPTMTRTNSHRIRSGSAAIDDLSICCAYSLPRNSSNVDGVRLPAMYTSCFSSRPTLIFRTVTWKRVRHGMDVDCNEATIFIFCTSKSLAPFYFAVFALLFLCFMLTSGKLSRILVFLKRNIISDLVVEWGRCPTTCVVQGGKGTERRSEHETPRT